MTGHVRTVLGDIPGESLGATDYHEHVFQASPLLAGDELDDEDASATEVGELRQCGFASLVDATPIGLGRRPTALARVSLDTGVRIVASTGAHRDAHYATGHPLLDLSEQTLVEMFIRDIEEGMPSNDAASPRTDVRAGLIKTGIDYWSISLFERRVLSAAAATHARTGAPVMVHLEHGSAAHEVLDVLGEGGVPPSAIVLAHVDRNLDPGLHVDLAARGAYLGFDGWARHRDAPDSQLIDTLAAVSGGGATERILIGGDVARRNRYRAYGGMPGLRYLGDRVLPRLKDRIGADALECILSVNPARVLGRF